MPRRAALLVASLLVGGCLRSDVYYHCDQPNECVSGGVLGTCEPTGWCSFPDDTCPDGRRYGDLAGGGLAGSCLGMFPDAAADGPGSLLDAAPGVDGVPGIDAEPGLCGNHTIDDGEDCDDGNDVDTDGCIGCHFARCGDGTVRAGVEDCDDGNTMDGDTCSSVCIDCTPGDVSFVWPDSGHCYLRFNTNAASWNAARATCADLDGHLVTFSSLAENDAVRDALVANGKQYWIGLNDVAAEGTYVWDDDRPLGAFTNWNAGEPNGGTGESCIEQFAGSGKWNDLACTYNGARTMCELEGWSIDPETGHAYRYFGSAHADSSFSASIACGDLGGGAHLATITSAAEQTFVDGVAQNEAWIGFDDIDDEGTFTWVTGEPVDYTHWGVGQPSSGAALVDCVTITGDGTWDDRPCTNDFAYVCEID